MRTGAPVVVRVAWQAAVEQVAARVVAVAAPAAGAPALVGAAVRAPAARAPALVGAAAAVRASAVVAARAVPLAVTAARARAVAGAVAAASALAVVAARTRVLGGEEAPLAGQRAPAGMRIAADLAGRAMRALGQRMRAAPAARVAAREATQERSRAARSSAREPIIAAATFPRSRWELRRTCASRSRGDASPPTARASAHPTPSVAASRRTAAPAC